MLRERLPQILSNWLYRGRIVAAALALLFILYCVIYLWFYIPYGSPIFVWRPDSQLVVRDATRNQFDSPLRSGDVVLAVDGQRPKRMQPVFSLPLRSEYAFVVQRQGIEHTYTVPVFAQLNRRIVGIILPASFISLVSWFVGALILFFARRKNEQAVHAGYIFLLAGAVLIGIQASLVGVPGAWVTGHVLIYFLSVGWVYMGLIPRIEPLGKRARTILLALFVVASGLSMTAVYEVVVLFPQTTSFQEIFGVSWYALSFLISALGLLACVGVLIWRALHLSATSYLRQQLWILLFFFVLGVLPTMLLTIIPRALADVALLPFPVAISLLVLIPAGYLFVIYRKGFLGLDIFFSRTLYLVMLSLVVFGFYATGLYLVQSWLRLEGAEALAPATVIFFPTLLVTIYTNQPVKEFVQRLIYGRISEEQERLTEFATALSRQPELQTLKEILTSLAALLGSDEVAMALKDDAGNLITILGQAETTRLDPATVEEFAQPLVRAVAHAAQTRALFDPFTWAEILVPIVVRNETIGLFALSRPGTDGYFNARQVMFLMQMAGVLAVASENIYLFESTRRLSREVMAAQAQERRKVAAQIHDDPMQQLVFVTSLVDQVRHAPIPWQFEKAKIALDRGAQHLRIVAQALRDICAGLYTPLLDQGLGMAVEEIIFQFQQNHGLQIVATIDGGMHRVPLNQATAVCHIITEALNNIVKHARATSVVVELRWSSEVLTLRVADDGCGMPYARHGISELARRRHLGILGMCEWGRSIDGVLEIRANTPNGTEVLLNAPLS